MADERCEWLDKDTAERLLSGGPVGAVDDHARAQAARLHAALDGAAPSADWAEADEFPGEKAALEAFRLARDGGADALGPVRRTAEAQGPVRAAGRWGRPVRFSVAALVAGCALSGVAVAAGTGMLPSPFGHSEPMPASSVSSAATPRPLISGSSSGTSTSASPGPDSSSHGSGESAPGQHGPRTSPPASRPGGDGGDGDSGTGEASRRGTPSGGTGHGPGAGNRGEPTPSGGSHQPGAGVLHKLAAACRDYRAGRVDGGRRRALESKAGGAANVEKFCGRVLGAGGSKGHRVSFTPSTPLTPAPPATSPAPSPSLSPGPSPSPTLAFPASPSPGDGNGAATTANG
ncbi:hypothetical protein [Streptomyces sp. NBC_01197]|uniref:hypothetical protein n=1 Tax=Streptomyces sp. NBC_01197 TaxID=2903768 RepID=UPI002E13D0D5|nr:hypothetical protein OG452_12645 [Streptomyces sp. NBC_01197]